MKPVLEYLPKQQEESFVVKAFEFNYYPTPWHYHAEYEIALIVESSGKRFIGDSVSDFDKGNLVFLGSNLPHTYRNDDIYYRPKSKLRARSIVVHFLESSLGEDFLALPEAKVLRQLFVRSGRGLDIKGKTNRMVAAGLHELLELNGLAKWVKLVELLGTMASSKDLRYISRAPLYGNNDRESDRLGKVMDFVIKNFSRPIRISEVASLVNMAENSFSRYFSQATKKTFISYLNEVRLNHAAKLLIENEMNISEICYECGFNNLSHFNTYFRKIYGTNPLAYRKEFVKKNFRS